MDMAPFRIHAINVDLLLVARHKELILDILVLERRDVELSVSEKVLESTIGRSQIEVLFRGSEDGSRKGSDLTLLVNSRVRATDVVKDGEGTLCVRVLMGAERGRVQNRDHGGIPRQRGTNLTT